MISLIIDHCFKALALHLVKLECDSGCQEERSSGDGEGKFHGEKPLNYLLS